MTVETPERAWTDPRLDDLNKKVDNGFAKVDADIRELRAEMKGEFKEVDKRMESAFARFDKKFDRLVWGLVTVGGVIISALIRSHAL